MFKSTHTLQNVFFPSRLFFLSFCSICEHFLSLEICFKDIPSALGIHLMIEKEGERDMRCDSCERFMFTYYIYRNVACTYEGVYALYVLCSTLPLMHFTMSISLSISLSAFWECANKCVKFVPWLEP